MSIGVVLSCLVRLRQMGKIARHVEVMARH